MVDNKEQRLFELRERVHEIMGMDDLVEKKIVPSYETHSFYGHSPYEIEDDINSWCGWRPWGFFTVVSLSYGSHVEQRSFVDTWINDKEYTAMVIFEVCSYKEKYSDELKDIEGEVVSLLKLDVDELGYNKYNSLIREALEV